MGDQWDASHEIIHGAAKLIDYTVRQKPPIPNGNTSVTALVISDLRQRERTGKQKYGTTLQADNGRDALMDAYQEALDLCQYLRQALEERDANI